MTLENTSRAKTGSSSTLVMPRVGQINFCNSLPFNLPIERGEVDLAANFVAGDPQFLNQQLELGNLEMSSVSSFFYVKNPDHIVVPDISISSCSSVGSVLFFHKKHLSQLQGENIAIPRASATSVRLLSLLLKLEAQVEAKFHVVDHPDLSAPEYDGALIIGDEALRVDPDWSAQANRVDLGQWWVNRFDLPMVFGIWVAKPEFVNSRREEFNQICDALLKARVIGTTELMQDVIDEAAKLTGLSQQRMNTYFTEELDFSLSEAHRTSLELYRNLCLEHKLA